MLMMILYLDVAVKHLLNCTPACSEAIFSVPPLGDGNYISRTTRLRHNFHVIVEFFVQERSSSFKGTGLTLYLTF